MVNWFFAITLILSGNSPVADYYSYSPEEFFALPAVHQTIDLKSPDTKLLEAAIFQASNEVRKNKRKATYQHSEILQQAAAMHGEYLYDTGKVDHRNTRERKYQTPIKRISAAGGDDFMKVAENLARITPLKMGSDNTYFIKNGEAVDQSGNQLPVMTYAEFAHKALNGWMNSEGHRHNLMADYDYLGCGVSEVKFNRDGIAEIVLVQNFGSKES